MAIVITDFTNNITTDNDYNVTGDGIFDDIMEAINNNIKAQYSAGRITGADYASVYLGAMQTAIAQASQIMLSKTLVDAQVAGEEAKADLINVQIQEEQYKLNTLLPDEHILNEKKEAQLDDELLTTAKQRDLISKDIELKNVQLDEEQYKLDVILPDEHTINGKKELQLDTQTAYVIEQTAALTTSNAKDLLVKDAQIAKTNSDKALIDAQEAEIALNATSNRAVKAKDLLVKDAQTALYTRQKQALDDSLLKDLYKEASGGTAMVYSELDGAITTPNSWSQVDEIANQILTSAGSTYQFSVANS